MMLAELPVTMHASQDDGREVAVGVGEPAAVSEVQPRYLRPVLLGVGAQVLP
jgi:hypothetical protein